MCSLTPSHTRECKAMGLGGGDTSQVDDSDREEEDTLPDGPQKRAGESAVSTSKGDSKGDEALYDEEGNALIVLCGLVLTRCACEMHVDMR